jgi:hypothetical protein
MRKIDVTDAPHSNEEIDRASVARVVAQVDLSDIRMVWARAGLNVPAAEIASDWGERTFMGYDVHAHEWSDDSSFFTVHALFAAVHKTGWTEDDVAGDGPPDLSEEDLPDVDIAVMFELTYSIEQAEGISDHDVEHFAAFNARFNAWPYWRELAQTVTNRMRIPTLLVPVLRLPGVRTPLAPPEESQENATAPE